MTRRCQKPPLSGLSVALACAVFVLGVGASAAGADSYGELTHFGKEGTGHVQFKLGNSRQVHAFGVDSSEGNSMYVVDEPSASAKGGEYRIQKISAAGQFLASVSIPFTKASRTVGIEGVAIDSALKRLYVLTTYERKGEEEGGGEAVDPEAFAAGTLYAFSTVASGEKLVPASVANAEGVLASKVALLSQSETRGQALLEPAGIAVDPTTHDVIIQGDVDLGHGEEELPHTALQRVGTAGANEVDAAAGRYVDTGNCLTGEEAAESCPPSSEGEPSSPIVTEGGKVFVGQTEQIWEIPTSAGKFAAGNPKPLLSFGNALLTLPIPVEPTGGGLSFVGEGAGKGTIYAAAGISQEGALYRGVLAFDFSEAGGVASASERGWTGGQTKGACSIGARGASSVAGAAAGAVFVLDPHAAENEIEESNEPHVTEFGASGSGCPHASVSEPTATVLGNEVTSAPPGAEVVLSSKLALGNALKAQWRFENTATKEVAEESSKGEGPISKIAHKFPSVGAYQITETVQDDNLATPTIVASRKFNAVAGLPTARFFPPAQVAPGGEARFNASTSEENGSPITKYIWSFGDGSAEVTTTSASIGHIYTAAGTYTVALKVVNAIGASAPTTHPITVASSSGGGWGGGGGGGNSNVNNGSQSPAPTTSAPSPAPPPPSTGVASYKVSVASAAVSVSPSGSLSIKVNCSGTSSCRGAVTLRTLTAVSASAHARKAILTLASGSFSVAGGHVVSVTLHLSAKARALLTKLHLLRARATIAAHDSAGASHTTLATVTLRPVKRKH